MKRILTALITLIAAAGIMTGCKHDKFRAIGGKGGSASLNIYPQHHGVAINLDSMVVYIKYDATDAPADGKYDDSLTCTNLNGQPTGTFSNLWNGDYYLYSKGYDYSVAQRVKGGLVYKITAQQPITINMPVSEDPL